MTYQVGDRVRLIGTHSTHHHRLKLREGEVGTVTETHPAPDGDRYVVGFPVGNTTMYWLVGERWLGPEAEEPVAT